MKTLRAVLVLQTILTIILLGAIAVADTASTQANIGNSGPVASSVAIALGNLDSGDIALTANTTTQINISATVTDDNGCTDITEVNMTLFRTNLSDGSMSSDDNRNHYSLICDERSGTCSGDTDVAAEYDCYINVTWYADPTDAGSFYSNTNWTVNVTPYDGNGVGTYDSVVHDMKTVTSFAIDPASINFGTLALGANTTTTNQNITVENLGNEGLDMSFTGYASSTGDNLSMNCTLGTIPIHILEYSSSAFTYGDGTDLTNTSTELDLDVDRGSEGTPRPTQLTFYGFAIPTTGVGGSCTGSVVITATSDPNLD